MSLVQGYSSGEDEDVNSGDVFGISKIPAVKKIRTEDASTSTPLTTEAAPHVLAEVSIHLGV
jgi:pre-mRNA-processing factor 17